MKGVCLDRKTNQEAWKKLPNNWRSCREANQPSELENASACAEEFENKYLRARAKCKKYSAPCQWRTSTITKNTVTRFGKSDLTITGQLRTCPCRRRIDRWCEERTGNGPKFGMLCEEEECNSSGRAFDHNTTWPSNTCLQMMNISRNTIIQNLQKGYQTPWPHPASSLGSGL